MKKILAGIAVLAVAAAAQAGLLASWNFTGSNSTEWGAGPHNGTTGDNVASATLTAVNMTPSGAANSLRFTGTSWGGTRDDVTASTSYLQVVLNAASGYEMTVESIDYRTVGSGTGQGGTAVWADSNSNPLTASWTTANEGASAALTTPVTGSTVELRLMAALTANGGTFGLNGGTASSPSLQINGTTQAVPEPATMSLLGLGALAMVIRRKLRK